MIGARPYALTVVAAALIALAVLDVVGTDAHAHPAPCAGAVGHYRARDYAAARTTYAAVLTDDPGSRCASDGLARTETALCSLAHKLSASDPRAARRELEAIATSAPVPTAGSCIWSALDALPS